MIDRDSNESSVDFDSYHFAASKISTWKNNLLSLDSKEEERVILNKFNLLLDQALHISDARDLEASDLVAKLKVLNEKVLFEFKNLDSLNFSKFVRSVAIGYCSINFKDPNFNDLRFELKKLVSANYVDKIRHLYEKARGRELLAKRNWEQHSRGNQKMREEWLNNWLDDLLNKLNSDGSVSDTEIQGFLESIAFFVDKKVNIVEHNGKKVVFLDWDREFLKYDSKIIVHPAVELLIASPKVHSVMIEYFAPELKANFRGENIPEKFKNHPLTKKILLFLKKYTIGYVDGKNPEKTQSYKRRLFGFDAISQQCIKHEKDVLVGDIADSYQYMIARDLVSELVKWIGTIGIFAPLPILALGEVKQLSLRDFSISLQSFGLIVSLAFYKIFIKKGVAALDSNFLDKRSLHLEDARRLFLAKAIDNATKISSTDSSQEDSSILVIYPPHHINRMIDYLSKLEIPKQIFYKTVYPYLNYCLRRYSKNKETENGTAKIYSGWSLTSSTSLD